MVDWGLGVVEKGRSGERRGNGAMVEGRMQGRRRRVERRAAILYASRVDVLNVRSTYDLLYSWKNSACS